MMEKNEIYVNQATAPRQGQQIYAQRSCVDAKMQQVVASIRANMTVCGATASAGAVGVWLEKCDTLRRTQNSAAYKNSRLALASRTRRGTIY